MPRQGNSNPYSFIFIKINCIRFIHYEETHFLYAGFGRYYVFRMYLFHYGNKCWGRVYRNDRMVGYIRAGGYGHHLGGAVGLAMIQDEEPIKKAYIESGKWDVEIDGVRYPIKVSIQPMYDPKLEKVKS